MIQNNRFRETKLIEGLSEECDTSPCNQASETNQELIEQTSLYPASTAGLHYNYLHYYKVDLPCPEYTS